MNKMLKCLSSGIFALAAFATEAGQEVSLAGGLNDTTSYAWTSPPVWQNGYVPTNAGDVVSIGSGNNTLMLNIPAGNVFEIDSIVETYTNLYFRLAFGAAPARVTVRQLSGYNSVWPITFQYNGSWKLNGAYSGFEFTGTWDDPTIVPSYYLGTLPYFGVPREDGAARIERLVNEGFFAKNGPGSLTVKGPHSSRSGVYLQEGEVIIDAKAEERHDIPAPGAVFHVDASNASTLQTVKEGGREYVTNWLDAAGGELSARNTGLRVDVVNQGIFELKPPYISERKVNGRSLVDFGRYMSFGSETQTDKPAGALAWSETVQNAREVFLAVEMTEIRPGHAGVVSYSGACQFYLGSQTNVLFQNAAPLEGDVRINGINFIANKGESCPLQMRVISCRIPVDQRLDSFGRVAFSGYGGFRLGEALIYTKELTEVERRQTIAYLKARWLPSTHETEKKEWDLGDVVMGTGGVSRVGVPEGGVARVRRIQALPVRDGEEPPTLKKTGGGRLVVDSVTPSTLPITVEEGSFAFSAVAAKIPAAPQLPGDPAFNFDASDDDAFSYEDAEHTRVTGWRDSRVSSALVATNFVYKGVRSDAPVRRGGAEGSPTGRAIVDFSVNAIGGGNTTNPRLQFAGAGVREAFLVWKNTYKAGMYYRAPHFSTFQSQVFAGRLAAHTDQLLHYSNNQHLSWLAGGLWRINGITVNPLSDAFGRMKGDGDPAECEWLVINFSTTEPMVLDAIAAQLSQGASGGGCKIAQFVGYERMLSDSERRSAEAYLMKYWLGKSHPDEVAWNGPLAFGERADNQLETDVDITPSSVSFASGSFTKTGSGTFDIGSGVSTLSSIAVGGGALEADLKSSLCEDALFHVDASRPQTLELTDRGDGTYAVIRWNDVRGNGLYAQSDRVHCQSDPMFTVETATGLSAGRGYVDFGPTSVPVDKIATNILSSAMTWNVDCPQVMELHLVYADNATDGVKVGNPVGHTLDQSGFIRQYSQTLVYGGFQNMMCSAALDGEPVSAQKVKPAGFHVVSLVVTNHYDAALTVGRLNTFANDRNLCFGGVRIAEAIVFEGVLDPVRRQEINAMLLDKWRGIGEGVSHPFDSIEIAAGAVFDLKVSDGMNAKVERLAFAVDGSAAGLLRIDGTLDLSVPGSVELSYAELPEDGSRVKLIDAGRLHGIDKLAYWTVIAPGRLVGKVKLVADGDSGDVYAVCNRGGMRIIVR